MGWLASTLLADEGSDARKNTTATTATTPAMASNTHIEYLSAKLGGAYVACRLWLHATVRPELKDVAAT